MNKEARNDGPSAPLVSQNSEEEIEAEIIKKNLMQNDCELKRI